MSRFKANLTLMLSCLCLTTVLLGITASAQERGFESPFALPQADDLSEWGFPTPTQIATPPLKLYSTQTPAELARLLSEGVRQAKAGRLSEAEALFREALKSAPENPKVWNNLGLTLRRLNKPDDAVAAYHQAVRADPNFALAYKNVAYVLEDLKEYRRAAKAYRKYAELAPTAADAHQATNHATWLETQVTP
ncbi:MAG: tetratricopeptide repeat protein [Deltaproteobacteria bacterium]|nr:tetratricopeptide repeat protein [Deltaproteobacteria bacterium]